MSASDLEKQAKRRIGTLLNGKWRLDSLIGVGGMASVYTATHRNGKRAAVKMLHPHVSFSETARHRFLREGYAANSIDHPGVVTVDDDDVTEDGSAFLVMELLDGETLEARWVRKGQKLSPEDVLSMMDQVLAVLAKAHAKGIVHRDVKPENLFLTREGVVKVLDFGIARLREQTSERTKTQTGVVMGTPAFMAPEQARGRWDEVDAQTDLWAVGATMFTLLTGRLVHEADTANEFLALAMLQHPRSVSELEPTLNPSVITLVDRALAYDKEDRFPNAEAMQQALRKAYQSLEHDPARKNADVPTLRPAAPARERPKSGLTTSEEEDTRQVRQAGAARGHRAWAPTPTTGSGVSMIPPNSGGARSFALKRKRAIQASVGATIGLGLFVGVFWTLSGHDDVEETGAAPREQITAERTAAPTPRTVAAAPTPPEERVDDPGVVIDLDEPEDWTGAVDAGARPAPRVPPNAGAPKPKTAALPKQPTPRPPPARTPQEPATPKEDPFSKRY